MQVLNNKALRISFVSVLLNLTMTLMKLLAGIFGNSYALVSDAIHSMADMMSSLIVAAGVCFSNKKFECVAAALVAAILLATGISLGVSSLFDMVTGAYKTHDLPSTFALVMSVIPLVAKECMYRYEKRASEELDSPALYADALHHRADEFVSAGVLAGVLGGYLGYEIVDTLAGFAVALLIIKASVSVFASTRRTLN